MTLIRDFIEMLRVSGSMFMLFCAASAIGIFLLLLLGVSFVTSMAKRTAI